jgi:hypothetical protein
MLMDSYVLWWVYDIVAFKFPWNFVWAPGYVRCRIGYGDCMVWILFMLLVVIVIVQSVTVWYCWSELCVIGSGSSVLYFLSMYTYVWQTWQCMSTLPRFNSYFGSGRCCTAWVMVEYEGLYGLCWAVGWGRLLEGKVGGGEVTVYILLGYRIWDYVCR